VRSIRGPAADEDGNATVLGAFVIAAIAAVLVLVIYVGAAVLARHRAQSAADLAALAAAVDHAGGGADPCGQARSLARVQRPRVEVVSCRIDGADAVVSVRLSVELGGFGTGEAIAVARAGPVE